MIEWIVIPIVMLAGFVNAAAGFGSGLVAMPLLVATVGLEFGAPFFVLVLTAATLHIIYRYRADLNLRAVWQLSATAILAIPPGVLIAERVDERIVVGFLGVFLITYAIYALIGPQIPRIPVNPWAYVAGLASGMLTGAYNTGGPPVILYASSQRWPLETFKGNLQTFFFINNLVLIFSHFIDRNFTTAVVTHAALAIPAVFIAGWLGGHTDHLINQETFRRLILILLIVLGLFLIAQAT